MVFKKEHIVSQDTRDKISKSKLGSKNGMYGKTPWNKGKSWSNDIKLKISKNTSIALNKPDIKKRNSESKKGKHLNPKTEFKKGNKPWFGDDPTKNPMYGKTGEKNPFYNKKHTAESLKIMSEAQKDRVGPKAANWKGGISFEPYCHKFNKQLKERIRDRDNRTCQLCGEKENGKKLTCHHIHYDKKNCYPDLIALCTRCNFKVNGKRDHWEKFFMELLEKRGLLHWC